MSAYKYDHTYGDNISKEFESAMEKADLIQEYSFEVEDGFRMPPVLDCIKLFSLFTKDDYSQDADDHRDKVLHQCLLNKEVTIYLNNEKVGSFKPTSLNDIWDAFPEVTEHPIGFRLIRNCALWYVVGKFKPSLKKEAGQAVAGKATKR